MDFPPKFHEARKEYLKREEEFQIVTRQFENKQITTEQFFRVVNIHRKIQTDYAALIKEYQRLASLEKKTIKEVNIIFSLSTERELIEFEINETHRDGMVFKKAFENCFSRYVFKKPPQMTEEEFRIAFLVLSNFLFVNRNYYPLSPKAKEWLSAENATLSFQDE
jgi:uncharacterized protein with von Willebrand factor type A (vWA) domain